LFEAVRASREVHRFVMFYIEQEIPELDTSLSSETIAYRTALADPLLGSFINQNVCSFDVSYKLFYVFLKFLQFIFMAGYSTHPYCKRIMKLVESSSGPHSVVTSLSQKRKPPSYPLLVVLSANPSLAYGYSDNLEWLATLSLEKVDITPTKIANYLNKVLFNLTKYESRNILFMFNR